MCTTLDIMCLPTVPQVPMVGTCGKAFLRGKRRTMII